MTDQKSKEQNQDQGNREDKKKEFLPPLDFSSIVFPFYTQALVKLGLLQEPNETKQEESLELAKRLIDLLDLLMDRTKGNLQPEEQSFLEACLQQLKMNYLEKAKIIKL